MNGNFPLLLLFIVLVACSQQANNTKEQQEKPLTIEFISEWSPFDYTIKDSIGNSITFHKDKDSSFYDYFRFRPVEDNPPDFVPKIDIIASMWKVVKDSIDIRLQSFSVGYPLEYHDILTRHIQAFIPMPEINDHSNESQHTTYQHISQRMFEQKVYPVDTLLKVFGYRATGLSIEKVGNVLPDRLETLGFDPNLKIPVPFMVWINVKKIKR